MSKKIKDEEDESIRFDAYTIEKSTVLEGAYNLVKISCNGLGTGYRKEIIWANELRSQCRKMLARIAEKL